MRIGIIGSGIAGLSSAWLFGSAGHEVVVYEKDSRGPIGQSFSFDENRRSCLVDVPSRLLNPLQWPTLMSLYNLAGVALESVDTTQSFSCLESKSYLNLSLANIFNINPTSLLNRKSRTIVSQILRFQKQGIEDLEKGLGDHIRFEDYLADNGYRPDFIYGFLYPVLSSTVCTCSYTALADYPTRIILETLSKIASDNSHEKNRLMRAKHGMRDVVRKLLCHEPVMVTGAEVTRVKRYCDRVEVETRPVTRSKSKSLQKQASSSFDHVVVATQANHAASLLTDLLQVEQDMLDCFKYEKVRIAVHTDARLMPADRKSWSTFNMITTEPMVAGSNSMCSIWINQLDAAFDAEKDVFQTINPITEPDPEAMIFCRNLQRPVVNQNSLSGWKLFENVCTQKDRRIWFAGSYACPGVPLLETGVKSAAKVAQSIGIDSGLLDQRPLQTV